MKPNEIINDLRSSAKIFRVLAPLSALVFTAILMLSLFGSGIDPATGRQINRLDLSVIFVGVVVTAALWSFETLLNSIAVLLEETIQTRAQLERQQKMIEAIGRMLQKQPGGP